MKEKEQKDIEETKAEFTFTVVLLKLLIVVAAVGLVWLVQMLFSNGEALNTFLREMSWR